MSKNKKIAIALSSAFFLVVLMIVAIILYPYFKTYSNFKNPKYIILKVPVSTEENKNELIEYRIENDLDIRTITKTIGFGIFKTVEPRDDIGQLKNLGYLEFPNIFTVTGNNHTINIFDDGSIYFGLTTEWNIVHIPELRDTFIKLRDKYHQDNPPAPLPAPGDKAK
jgi:hypothetical protein